MIYYLKIFSLLAISATTLASPLSPCALAGPGFPSPSRLSNSTLLSRAIAAFETSLHDAKLGLQANDTAWAVALFSSKENKTLYEHYYSPPIDIGVPKVDQDSIFRVGSVSKVFSVWSFLLEVGDEHFNNPITRYIPELANLTRKTNRIGDEELYNDLDSVRWDEVTLGQLASHAAGIPRDPTVNDLAVEASSEQNTAFGFPSLGKDEIPTCGDPGFTQDCTRTELFSYLLKQHPIFPTAHSPAYSNIAYTLLGYAQQAITGTPVSTAITNNILGALGMAHSSYTKTPSSGGVIPGGNASAVGWDDDLGLGSPAGAVYSSTSDMVKAGQAILQSTLMTRARTRRWLKPLTQTGHLSTAVGAPWEIRYLELPSERITQLYTKQGDVGTYHAALVLSPEHDIGWVVLSAGTSDSQNVAVVREALMNSFGGVFLPMAESQAEDEARVNFAGTFADEATNSSVTIEAGPSAGPGLLVTSLVSRGAQVIGPESVLIQAFSAGEFARLYPSNLRATSMSKDGSRTYDSRLGFRSTYFNATEPGKVQDPCLTSWTALGAPLYGQVALDDWVFGMGEDGQAESVDVRLLRLKMDRVK